MSCAGAGSLFCNDCSGDGRFATWRTVEYRWWVHKDNRQQFPIPRVPNRLETALHEWLRTHDEEIQHFDGALAERHLGYSNDSVARVLERAAKDVTRLEAQLDDIGDKCLFSLTRKELAPTGYLVQRVGSRVHTYWLIGRDELAREVGPAWRLSPTKVLLLPGCLLVSLGLTLLIQGRAALPAVSAALIGAALAGIAIHRMSRRAEPVRIVLVLGCRPIAPYLACLAAIGSYMKRFVVEDTRVGHTLGRLLGEQPCDRQTESLTVTLPNSSQIHVVAPSDPSDTSDDALAGLLRAVDGVVYLDTGNSQLATLRKRVDDLAATKVRSATFRVHDITVEHELQGKATKQSTSLEELRKAYLRYSDAAFSWHAVYQALWQPIHDVLPASTNCQEPAR